MNHRIGGSSARRAPLLARLSAAATIGACGCAAFTNPPLASFREPAAQMARALASKAEKPVFRESIPAEALFDVRIAGNRALLDYRTEGTGLGGFDALPACGPLELRDVASNERIWSVDRSGACDDVVLAILPRLLVRGLSAKGEPELTAMSCERAFGCALPHAERTTPHAARTTPHAAAPIHAPARPSTDPNICPPAGRRLVH